MTTERHDYAFDKKKINEIFVKLHKFCMINIIAR